MNLFFESCRCRVPVHRVWARVRKKQSIVIGNARWVDQGGAGVGSIGKPGRATDNARRSSHQSARSAVGDWHG